MKTVKDERREDVCEGQTEEKAGKKKGKGETST